MSTLRQKNKNLYWAWKSMKQRTQNPKCKAYKNYGARGITVCQEWQKFEAFFRWAINNGYKRGLELDRKNNDEGYSPENCRWVTRQENLNNRRITIYLTVRGETQTCSIWEKRTGIPQGSLRTWSETKGREYAERRILEALDNGYTPMDYGNQRKPVRHIESGKTFKSVRDAAKYFGMSSGTLSHYINYHDGKTGKGRFLWKELDDNGAVIGGNMECGG